MKLNASVIRDVSQHASSEFDRSGSIFKGLSKMVSDYRLDCNTQVRALCLVVSNAYSLWKALFRRGVPDIILHLIAVLQHRSTDPRWEEAL